MREFVLNRWALGALIVASTSAFAETSAERRPIPNPSPVARFACRVLFKGETVKITGASGECALHDQKGRKLATNRFVVGRVAIGPRNPLMSAASPYLLKMQQITAKVSVDVSLNGPGNKRIKFKGQAVSGPISTEGLQWIDIPVEPPIPSYSVHTR